MSLKMDKNVLRVYLTQNLMALLLIGIFIAIAVVLYISQAPIELVMTVIALIAGLIGGLLSSIGEWWKALYSVQSQLRLAALEKRLEAHQEAFALWSELVVAVHQDDNVEVAQRCRQWWNENCLYLTPEARKAFSASISHAPYQKEFVAAHADSAIVKENWDTVVRAGDIIEASVSLPPFSVTSELLEQLQGSPSTT